MIEHIIDPSAMLAYAKDENSNQFLHDGIWQGTRKNPHVIVAGLKLGIPDN
jgi:hypothetical protein